MKLGLLSFLPTEWLVWAHARVPEALLGLRVALGRELWQRETFEAVVEEARGYWS